MSWTKPAVSTVSNLLLGLGGIGSGVGTSIYSISFARSSISPLKLLSALRSLDFGLLAFSGSFCALYFPGDLAYLLDCSDVKNFSLLLVFACDAADCRLWVNE